MTPFDAAFRYLFKNEGSVYTNDPDDSGGPTKYGITKKTYERFYGIEVDDAEIEAMTPAIAKQIYAAHYWAPMRGGEIKSVALAIAFFDCAVLYGVGTTRNLIRRALSLCGAPIKLEGKIDDETLGFINLMEGGTQRILLMNTFHNLILSRIKQVIVENPKNEKYRRGWNNRAARLLTLLNDETINQLYMERT